MTRVVVGDRLVEFSSIETQFAAVDEFFDGLCPVVDLDFAVLVPVLFDFERHHRIVGELLEVHLRILVFERIIRVWVGADDLLELTVVPRLDVVTSEFDVEELLTDSPDVVAVVFFVVEENPESHITLFE